MAIGEATQKTPRYYTVAVLFLGFVLILTGIVLVYSMMVGSSNKDYAERLDTLNTSIKRLSDNPDIQAYQLYDENKRKIENMTYFSDVPLFYEEISDLGREFGITMSEFSYSDKKISIAASAVNTPGREAYQKYENLIASYREQIEESDESEELEEGDENQESEEAQEIEIPEQKMFDLEFVRSFQGANRIVSNLSFTILEPIPKKVEVSEDEEETGTGETLEQE